MSKKTVAAREYKIVTNTDVTPNDFSIMCDGTLLKNKDGERRYFKTRNSARKRIARERSGNLHA